MSKDNNNKKKLKKTKEKKKEIKIERNLMELDDKVHGRDIKPLNKYQFYIIFFFLLSCLILHDILTVNLYSALFFILFLLILLYFNFSFIKSYVCNCFAYKLDQKPMPQNKKIKNYRLSC